MDQSRHLVEQLEIRRVRVREGNPERTKGKSQKCILIWNEGSELVSRQFLLYARTKPYVVHLLAILGFWTDAYIFLMLTLASYTYKIKLV